LALKRITVYCGSSPGANPAYMLAAARLGEVLAGRGLGLVFGGGNVGLMGQIAKAAGAAGGEVIGVIPRRLVQREVALTSLADLRVVENMHERKALMAELADGFIALPGGYGTLEELFEMLTWGQLSLHQKPCGLLNIAGYFDSMLSFLDHVAEQQFIDPEHRAMLLVEEDPEILLDKFATYIHPTLDKARQALKKGKVE
jgi:uncharacterized protein (TIGR00730 family)